MRCLVLTLAVGLLAFTQSCRHTKPGTHVEVINKDGSKVYMAGAVAPGVSRDVACSNAVKRAVAAAALRFSQDFSGAGDDIADELGASDGEPILNRYARHQLMNAAVQDLDFDPMKHRCMATVRWKVPLFLKDALKDFAAGLKEEAQAESAPISEAPAPVKQMAPQRNAPAPCSKFQSSLEASIVRESQADAQLSKCLSKTEGDESICHRYKLKAEKATKDRERASGNLKKCQGA